MFTNAVSSDEVSILFSVFTDNPSQTGLNGTRVFIEVMAVKAHSGFQPETVTSPQSSKLDRRF
jgi:hypothetical protein